jgi:hypothetical protein
MLNVASPLLLAIPKSQKSTNPLLSPLDFEIEWFGHLVGPIMGVFCLARRLFLLFHLLIFSRIIPTKQGVLPTSEGVILTKQGKIREFKRK